MTMVQSNPTMPLSLQRTRSQEHLKMALIMYVGPAGFTFSFFVSLKICLY